eukprot:NODE_590_length_1328_cov_162.551994_g463_i0.p1 GENE.NODE_590_length_1328_cov_162.551994_g463_i0~~NODE_590_length_1328_cov_162.551994_g463_i0.p1  ORF type:complete len:329 (-),score=22.07 NODE_590_length_1328_cov_162.551994_g463_i0:280-1266(-)
MRLSLHSIPWLLIVALPLKNLLFLISNLPLAAWISVDVFYVFLIVIFQWLANVGSQLKPPPPILETITVSHFSEKVRWCLDWLDYAYTERQDVGILGIMLFGRSVPRFLVPRQKIIIGNSSEILRYLYGSLADDPKAKFLQPTTESLLLEKELDQYGASIQRFLYFYLLPYRSIMIRLWGAGQPQIPAFQRLLLHVLFPVLRGFLYKGLNITGKTASQAHDHIIDLLSRIEARLATSPSRFLLGASLTYVDIAFAALTAAISPTKLEAYGGRAILNQCFDQQEFPKALMDLLTELPLRFPKCFEHLQNMYSIRLQHQGEGSKMAWEAA